MENAGAKHASLGPSLPDQKQGPRPIGRPMTLISARARGLDLGWAGLCACLEGQAQPSPARPSPARPSPLRASSMQRNMFAQAAVSFGRRRSVLKKAKGKQTDRRAHG